MTVTADRPRFEIGRVMSRTFGVLGRNLVVFLVLGFFFSALPQAVVQYGQIQLMSGLQAGAEAGANGGLAYWPFLLFGGLASLVGIYLLQAALIHGTVADLNGRGVSLDDCISTGLRNILPLFAIGLLLGVALLFGFLLLIVPGVLMALAWCVAAPAQVVERIGVFGSFSRSAELTRGHRGAIFGLWLIWLVLAFVVSMIGQSIAGVFTINAASNTKAFLIASAMVNVPLQAAFSVIGAAALAAIYYELRSIKEGIGPEALAAVFD